MSKLKQAYLDVIESRNAYLPRLLGGRGPASQNHGQAACLFVFSGGAVTASGPGGLREDLSLSF